MSETQLKGCEYLLRETALEDLFTPEDFSDEHRQIAGTTEQFVANEVLPQIEEIEAQNFTKVVELLHRAGELGLMMVDGPEEYGGLNLDKVTSMLTAEILGRAGSFSVSLMAHNGIGTLPLVYYGTPGQKERYLEKLLTTEMLGAYCLTEPGSGSDALGAATSAVLSEDGTHYTLNGTKQFITNAAFADLFTVFAKVDKQHFTGFLVERGFEGVSIGVEEKKLGIKGSSTCQVVLDNVKVPAENLLGEIGKGHKIAFNVLNVGRFKLGAGATGAAKQAFKDAAQYANERKQFNTAISNFGAIKEKLADMVTEIFTSESVVYRLAGLLDDHLQGLDKTSDSYYADYQKGIEQYAAECAIAKVYCSEVQAFVADETLQIHGGYGFVSEYPAERYYRDARISRIYEGTNEINRILIPGLVLARGLKGEIPLQEALAAAFEEDNEPDTNVPFALEQAQLKRLKSLLLILLGAALEKFQNRLQQEQETLLPLADLAIQIFAMESAVLRAEKAYPMASAGRQALYRAIALTAAFRATRKAAEAAQKATYFIGNAQQLRLLRTTIARLTDFDASGLLDAKRVLAEAARENEKYIF
ncbi:acyl-CoA dehydrogenase family protein [Malonomonas rubra]|uniref:acyl-CoA dehydrogenase family protein n=1 Tax=Malonomonas rubra TaxID=57040 RepID=UPI0026EF1063|nr:acyl-CoA dehydrogenase family protein [Malonomonas rubra]